MFKIGLVTLFYISIGAVSFAQHKGINFQAVIRSPTNTYPNVAGLTATIQILTPDNCVLREEQHSNVNIANGYINLVLGGANSTALGGHNPSQILTLTEVFNNSTARTGLTCINSDNSVVLSNQTYTPAATHARKMRLRINIPGEGLVIADFNMRSMPFAENAEMLGGKAITDFIQVDAAKNVTQVNLNNFFSNGNFANINSILSGTYNAPTATSAVTATTAANVTGTVSIANGGTGATTQTGAVNALLPSQATHAGKYLTTDGTNVSWSAAAGGGATGSAGGDLTGTYPNPTLTTSGVVAGTYGATNKTISSIQVDAKGRITNIADSLISLNGNQITAGTIGTGFGGTGLATLGTADQILGMNAAATGYEFKTITAGSGVTITNAANSITIAATGAGSGTVTNVSSANTDISVATGTTTPVLTLNTGTAANQIVKLNASAELPALSGVNLTSLNASNLSSGTVPYAHLPVGTLANTVAAGNDARFTDARAPSGAAGGDLSGTYPNPSVAKVQGRAVDSALPADGQALLWDNANTTWKPQYVRMQDIRTSWGGTQMIPTSACAVNEAMVWSVVTDRFTCQSIALNATAITAGVIDNARLPDSAKYWSAAAGGIAYTGGNVTVAGSVQIGTDAAACAAGNSGAIRFNGGAVEFCNGTAWTAFSSGAGSGTVTNVSSANADIAVATGTTTPVLTLNTGTTANQIIKLDGNAKLPAVDGSQLTNIQAAQIPDLDAAKITTGILPIARGGTNSSTALNNNRIMASSGGAIAEAAAITASRALVSDVNGIPTHSIVTNTELGYLSGVTSAIQTQIDGKSSTSGWTNFSVMGVDGSGALTAVPGVASNTMLQWTVTGPAWSSAAYPSSTAANQLLYSSANNVVGGLPTANNAILTTDGAGVPSWSVLSNDSFTQYALLAGRSGGQTINGGIAAGQNLTLDSTAHATKGNVLINPTAGNVGIGTSNPWLKLSVAGGTSGIFLSTTDFAFPTTGSGVVVKTGAATGNTYGSINVVTAGGISNGSLVLNSAGGNIGIGTTSPGAPLDVKGEIRMSGTSSGYTGFKPAANAGSVVWTLPIADGTSGQVLSTNGVGILEWITPGGGGTVTNVTSANSDIGIATGNTTPVLTLNSGTTGGAGDANKIAKLDASGLIATAMLPNLDTAKLTSGILPIARGGTNSSTALNNNRIMASSGGAIVEATAITASRALVSDVNGIPTHSAVTSTELGYLSGVTSAVQTQIDGKISSSGWANYSVISTNGAGALTEVNSATANTMLQWTLTGPAFSSATYPSSTTANQLLYSSAANAVTGLAAANNAVLITNGSGVPSWSDLTNDTFTQYALLSGRAGGQTLTGGTAVNNNLVLESTSNPTKGYVVLQPNGGNVGIGTTSPQAGLDVATTGATASAMIVPRDTVANRPNTPVNGMIRYASDTNKFEAYENGVWTNMIGGGGGSGTVTSVGLSLPAEITVTNSPVTTTGTLTGAWASQTQKTFLAAPNAANGAPSFRTIAASDLPAEGGDLSGSYGSVTVVKLQNRTLANTAPALGSFLKWNGTLTQWEPGGFATCNGASQVMHYSSATDTWNCDTVSVTSASGTLPIANGGTGATTANDALNALVPSQTGNSGKFLTTDGTNVSWAAGGGGGGTPGGANTQIQFNNNGSFGGSANLTWDNTTSSFTVTGDISYTGILTDTSDRRLKTDIIPLNAASTVEKLGKINTYSFRMKEPSNAPVEFGVMAQEVEEIFPELVRTANNEMKTKSVNYIGFIAPLIEANRQLQRELAAEKTARMEIENNLKEIRQESRFQVILTAVAFMMVLVLGSFGLIYIGRISKVKLEDKSE